MTRNPLCVIHACALLLVLASPVASHAAETGSVCVRDYSSGVDCSGNDVWIASVEPLTLLEDCASGDPSTAEAVFEVTVSGGASSRYDVGLFLALNGDSALSGGQCLHDYLEPPLDTAPTYGDVDGNGRPDLHDGPWWNGEPFEPNDSCGDIAAGTDAIKTLIAIRFACVDGDEDGTVDLSTCTSWSNGTTSRCQGLSEAYPPTSPRCGCNVVETGVPMPGAAVASGRIAGLRVDRDGSGDLLLSWSGSCSASDTDYGVYEGTLGQFSTHESVVCTTAGATAVGITPAPGDRYFLVVPRNAQREGSYGKASSGTERPQGASACVAQQIQEPCL